MMTNILRWLRRHTGGWVASFWLCGKEYFLEIFVAKFYRRFIAALSACILVVYASLAHSDYLVGQKMLADRLAESFPVRQSLQDGLFDATVGIPKLSFFPAAERIGLSAAFSGSSTMGGEVEGLVELTSGLRYDVKERAVYLVDARLDKIVAGENTEFAALLLPSLNAVLGAYLQHEPIYRVADDQLHFAGVEVDITSITVAENGIKLAISPRL